MKNLTDQESIIKLINFEFRHKTNFEEKLD